MPCLQQGGQVVGSIEQVTDQYLTLWHCFVVLEVMVLVEQHHFLGTAWIAQQGCRLLAKHRLLPC